MPSSSSSPPSRTGLIFTTVFAVHCVVVMLIMLPASHGQIDCYKCTAQKSEDRREQVRLCSMFNGSDYFKVHCPNSTYCTKTFFQLKLPDGKIINGTERGCTFETYSYYVYKNKKWETEWKVDYGGYKSGCYSGNEVQLRTSDTTFCYCEENLCNGAEKPVTKFSAHTDTIAVIIIYNIMRFLKTHTQPA